MPKQLKQILVFVTNHNPDLLQSDTLFTSLWGTFCDCVVLGDLADTLASSNRTDDKAFFFFLR